MEKKLAGSIEIAASHFGKNDASLFVCVATKYPGLFLYGKALMSVHLYGMRFQYSRLLFNSFAFRNF